VHFSYIPYPTTGYSSGDAAWQLTAATLVGLMSLPGLAVLYGGLVQKKWAVNTMLMAFSAFSLVLVVWALWAFNMGFGSAWIKTTVAGSPSGFVGKPRTSLGAGQEAQASIPLLQGLMPPFNFSESALFYFQFVFAAITPLLFLGSVLGRIKFSAWCLLVPLWSTFVYGVDAFMLWGGGYFAQEGSLDFSGGYVIHMSAGVSGFVAAWVLGPRLLRDRQHALPNNLVMAAVGAGILWLGWNGFNGGDPYYAGASAASAVINTNIATATGVVVWMALDAWLTKERKPTFLGGVNGMICGLVGITPCAGWVNGRGAIFVGATCCAVVWVAWNFLSKVRPFSKVDDALGVVYTHGIAGFMGGMLLGIWGDPNMVEYGCGHLTASGQVIATSNATYLASGGKCVPFSVNGLMYTGSAHQLWEQFRAAVWVIFWSALVTFILMQIIKLVLRGVRYKDSILEVGDLAIHGEEAFPEEAFATRTGGAFAMAGLESDREPPISSDPSPPAGERS
jgi:ammonium transporter, Amt family